MCGPYNDNLFEDPLFCDVFAPDLTLCQTSPCLPENNVFGVLIGAHEQGCGTCSTAVQRTTWGAIKALYAQPR